MGQLPAHKKSGTPPPSPARRCTNLRFFPGYLTYIFNSRASPEKNAKNLLEQELTRSRIFWGVMPQRLDRYGSTNIGARAGLRLFGGGRESRADDVHQGLAYFSRARSNYLTLLIFQNINSAGRVEGENHWPCVHGGLSLLFPFLVDLIG